VVGVGKVVGVVSESDLIHAVSAPATIRLDTTARNPKTIPYARGRTAERSRGEGSPHRNYPATAQRVGSLLRGTG
jgi:hypothetical protein